MKGAAFSGTISKTSDATSDFEPAGQGVLDTIARSIGPAPRVLLSHTTPDETPGPIVRPTEADAYASTRYRIDGEIARGGMGVVLKGRDPTSGATLPSRCFGRICARMPARSNGSWRRPRSAAASRRNGRRCGGTSRRSSNAPRE